MTAGAIVIDIQTAARAAREGDEAAFETMMMLTERHVARIAWRILGDADDVPACYGVMVERADGALDVQRAAPQRALKLPFGIWMALARATPEPHDDDAQAAL